MIYIIYMDSKLPSNLKKIINSINSLKDKVNLCKFSIIEINNDIQKLDSTFTNYLNSLQKPKKDVKRGFSKPMHISEELSIFLNLSKESLISRTEVTKKIVEYIKNNNLQCSNNKQIIKPDDKLKTIIDSKDEEITFFTMQKYLTKHFIKKY